ncbi:YidC/Oxa1 family membrane protein insertase [Lachnoclostridium phytofermentans]|uniref:60 kDa inner membrane insertion protein n=1 Tax=Lachnoclostridium phytofermentans (strain ATCC 700394 / DSM 18823 / ISDg) TaxID=357809 RepID=A9KLY1_LACP7|nr:YidC/Oxa1 family membrane protein insertase [Lachnoclostridium phytofermentans]ABX44290.1 60 kDa inner membrane insertion protein [Lachnoclostridium phytofermentans ISDg]
MDITVLTQVTGILGPFAWVMGIILNGIYEFLSIFGMANIAICIVIFTFVIKMLMLPLTIKQQKGTRLSAKMNPEIQKVQAKYKGKKDQASMQKQQAEMQEIYAKYGASPLSGCLPLLISLPIMFALYRVIYAVPAYVNDVKSLYDVIAQGVIHIQGFPEALAQFAKDNSITANTTAFAEQLTLGKMDIATNKLIDIFAQFKTANWEAFMLKDSWNANYLQFLTSDNLTSLQNFVSGINVKESVDQIIHINRFIGNNLNILDAPGFTFPGILIPLAAAGSQFAQSKLMMTATPQSTSDDTPGAQSLKTMNTVMPVVSGIFCTFLPIGVGIYWIASSVVQILQQIFINKYLDKIDIDDMIAKSVAKSSKRKEKYGVVTGNTMANVAKTTTKAIDVASKTTSETKTSNKEKEQSNYKKSNVSYAAGSIAANANILKRDSDKGDKK